jgi:adenylate cyclase
MERKLTAILCADVYGYSRLMQDDEEATFRTLASHRRIIGGLIEQHHGRFVNSAGDSVLAEFTSVVNAVQCGIGIQAALEAVNASLASPRRMQFRIGINLGDVIVDHEQIYGDGVNVAARLESLAEPGGICISGKVHDEVRGKLPLGYADLGLQRVKNIAEPVRVWRVLPDGAAPARRDVLRIARSHWRGSLLSLAGLAILITAIVLVQQVSFKQPRTSASIPPPQRPALALPDKPSIAVLPFINMSGDREQEYFSDGITDDLITDLSRLPGLFVIARASTFAHKGKAAKLQDVSRQLGVKYVLEGSVRKAAGQVRITVQLADATTGAELWAERYDRPLRDVFALQDEIVRRILTTLNLQIALSRRGVVISRTTENLEAYDDLLRGTEYFLSYTKDGNVKAREMFERAIALDPKYAAAYASLGSNYHVGWSLAFNPDPDGMERALQMEQKALALDDSLAPAHSTIAQIDMFKGRSAEALTEAQRGIALDPNSALGYAVLAAVLNVQWKSAEALVAIEKAMRLNPLRRVDYLFEQGGALSQLGRWEQAIPALKDFSRSYPDFLWAHVWLAVDHFNLGDQDTARAERAQVERLIGLTPNAAMGYYALALMLNAQGKPAEVLAAAQKGLRFDPKNRGLLLWQGVSYMELGRWEDSLSALKHYVALDAEDLPAWSLFAHVFLFLDHTAMGETNAARAEAAEVRREVAVDPNSSLGYLALVLTLNGEGKPAEALVSAQNAVRLDPGNSPYYLWWLGVTYSHLERWEEAISALKGYVDHYPDQLWPHVNLAVAYIEVGRDDTARAEVAQVLRINPQFSLKTGVEGMLPMQKERVGTDLAKAGLT